MHRESRSRRKRDGDGKNVVLLASVLHLRGVKCMKQPFSMKVSDILLWNGEVFGGRPVVMERERRNESLKFSERDGGFVGKRCG